MTPFEFIMIFLLGGMAIQMVVTDDRSLVNALLGIATVALNQTLVSTLKQRSENFGRFADGTPVVILEHGKWHEDRMHHLRVQAQDVMTAARQQGIETLDQVKTAAVERNGAISVFKKDDD
jgi:uncharacterized membrane protein YcaP (DUF421 family)